MTRFVAFHVMLAACSPEGGMSAGGASQRAALEITFGPSTVFLEASVISNTTSSRLMMQSRDANTTVFVSLAIPLPGRQIALSTSAETASIWAKQGSMLPLIATSGMLTVDQTENSLSFVFDNVSKPDDSSGTSLLITGSMTGVSAPP